MKFRWRSVLLSCAMLILWLALPAFSFGKEAPQKWDLVNPEGVIQVKPMKVNPHPATLEGKTVVLRWNGKHNGDNFLNRIAELLAQQVKDVKIIKAWEAFPETPRSSSGAEASKDFAKKIASLKPDLVIASQAD
jgi:hypothetical protein